MKSVKKLLFLLAGITMAAGSVSAADISADSEKAQGYISRSLKTDTILAPNGAVTVMHALNANRSLGAESKTVEEMTDGVYHIRGWGIAHTIAIDAPEGFIIVDTGDSTATAAEMRSYLEEKLGEKINVAAILYTHNHYTDGTEAWMDEGTEIWGHEDLDRNKRADQGVSILSGNVLTRGAMQFGILHPAEGPDAFPNNLGFGADKLIGIKSYLPPTHHFIDGEIMNLIIAGEPVEVAPNRTDTEDSVGFYFPLRDTLVTNTMGIEFMFNIYTLRGAMYRDPQDYLEAHDWALSKNAGYLLDIHGPGYRGEEKVRETLERLRDQTQLINDQTLRMISLGMDARQAAENVYMPEHLRDGHETYGQVESQVKQIYYGNIGWMGNDVYDINPLSVNEEARRTVELMGGFDAVRAAAAGAAEEGGFENWSWAIKLTGMLLELNPADSETKAVRAEAARAIGHRTTSANARGFYITEALAMEDGLKLGEQTITLDLARTLLGTPSAEAIKAMPLEDSFEYIRYLVDPRKAEDNRLKFSLAVEGKYDFISIELRNGVIVLAETELSEDVHIELTLDEWSRFVAGEHSLAEHHDLLEEFEGYLTRGL